MLTNNKIFQADESFRYQLLSRLESDCKYYLGNGNRHSKHLWAEDEAEHIMVMKQLWNSFPHEDKPEWLGWDEILAFESEMIK